jgi:hypothetical protein
VARTSIAATIIAWSLLTPAAAGAKGLQHDLTIVSGPGLAHPLILDNEEWGVPQDWRSPQAVVIEGLLGAYPKASRPPAKGGLGPAYEVHYQVAAFSSIQWPGPSIVRQRLFPFASPGPVTFTPRQFWRNPSGPNRIEPGWQRFPVALVERLQRYGLPEHPPVHASPAASPMAIPMGLTTGAVALALAALVIRWRDPILAP